MREQSVNFDRAADYYDATRGYPEHEQHNISDFIAQSAHLKTREILLEIGVGTGRMALPLSTHVKQVYGIDISHKMMKKLHEKQNQEMVYVTQADAERLPFPNHCFDAVFVSHVFHLVRDVIPVLDEITRITQTGGKLLHCRTDRNFGMGMLDNRAANSKWQAARNQIEVELKSRGWHFADTSQYVCQVMESPYDFLHAIENRLWSSTWDLSDEQLQTRIDSIKAAIDEHFDGDAHKSVESEIVIALEVWQAPA